MKPIVSIITACFNADKWVAETLQSCLNQSFRNWECIIVNDGSTDGSEQIIKSFVEMDERFKLISQSNKGLSAARNVAIANASGTYLIPLDADDLIGHDFLTEAVKWMKQHPECPCVFGKLIRFGENMQEVHEELRIYGGMLSLLTKNQHSVTALFKASDARAIGGYEERLPAYEDWQFWIKLYDYTQQDPHGIDVVSFHYRQHTGSLLRWADARRKIIIDRMKYLTKDIYDKYRPMATTDKTTYVVMMYFAGPAQGREIEFAVEGWRRYFKDPFKLVIVGDYHPVISKYPEIDWLECPRINPDDYPGQYIPHIDHIHKMQHFLRNYPEADGFIRCSDDEYPINDFDLATVRLLKLNNLSMEHHENGGAWEKDEAKTYDLLRSKKFPHRGFVCHIPFYVERSKFEYLVDKYDLANESYVFEDMYFNIFYPYRPALLLNIDTDCIRCGVWRPNPDYQVIRKAMLEKTFMNNSVVAYTGEFEKFMANYFMI